MRTHIRMGCAVATAAATMTAMGLAATGTAGAASGTAPRMAAHPQVLAATPGAQLWASRYNGSGNGPDVASSVAVSPHGNKVFVTGSSYGGSATDSNYATVAYNAATGKRLWVKGFTGSGNRADSAAAVRVSPRGNLVFVTGTSLWSDTGYDFTTIAYTPGGAQRWVRRYNGPSNSTDSPTAMSVAPDGSKVFVTGWSYQRTPYGNGSSYATVAYNAATGAQLWVSHFNGPLGEAVPAAVVSPGGNRVFVTGYTRDWEASYATVAYNATTGAELWVQRYNAESYYDVATALAASPDASRVFVTGRSFAGNGGDYTTVAYNAATGAELWLSRYNGPGVGNDYAEAVTVAPDGSKVFVTGSSEGATGMWDSYDYATVAYNAKTGAQLWSKRYNGPGNGHDGASSVVSPGNGKVYVTGISEGGPSGRDYATVAYNAATGAQLWVKRYNGTANGTDEAYALAATRDGSRLFVTGASMGATSDLDFATIAYQG